MKTVITLIVLILVVWLGFTFLQDGGFGKGDVIKIGFMAPLTGDAASYGESIQRGVNLALKESGLENIELITEDSKCEGTDAVNAINKLITADKVSAVLGEVCSGATLAAAPVAESNKIPLLSPVSSSPAITDAGEFIWRTFPSDALQGQFGAELVHKNGMGKLAILYGNEEYGVGFEKVLRENFETLGGTVVASESFERQATDLRTQLAKIKTAKPDAIYVVSNSPSSAVAAIKQIKELDIEAALYGSEALKSDEIIKDAGDAAEGMIVTSVTLGSDDFIEKYKAEYGGVEPEPFAAQGYDAFMVIAEAIKTGAKTGEEINAALANVSFDGASGKIAFDRNGDIAGNYVVYTVTGGMFVEEGSDAMMMEEGKKLEVALSELNSSGVSGTALITERDGKAYVSLVLEGASAKISQPAHIHTGSCAELGDVKYHLTDVKNEVSETMLEASIDDIMKGLPLAINVHKSADEISAYIACGDITDSGEMMEEEESE
ncbi:penicillin-binding protein activator [bacterium]|nr:penicillin-binding protein activator [bacterium]MCI0679927.1 penicillin-binding protein activator [bacterium]